MSGTVIVPSERAKAAAAEVLAKALDGRYSDGLAEWMIAVRIQQEIEAERAACAAVAQARSDSLADWMRKLAVGTAERVDKSLRSGEAQDIAAEIRERGKR